MLIPPSQNMMSTGTLNN
uniref:Uncharacterized protein n=1 Tax=Rhizophora mucronata TaxID=61149 RepID=A0A2P2L2Z7_RHIMU